MLLNLLININLAEQKQTNEQINKEEEEQQKTWARQYSEKKMGLCIYTEICQYVQCA